MLAFRTVTMGVLLVSAAAACASTVEGEGTRIVNLRTGETRDLGEGESAPEGWGVCVDDRCPALLPCEDLDETSCLARSDCDAEYAGSTTTGSGFYECVDRAEACPAVEAMCPDGYTSECGQCVPNACPLIGVACPDGYEPEHDEHGCMTGECVPQMACLAAYPVCPDGTVPETDRHGCPTGECVPEPSCEARPRCEEGYEFDEATCSCAPIPTCRLAPPSCPEGEEPEYDRSECPTGECVPEVWCSSCDR